MRFLVFQNGKPARNVVLSGAYLFGMDMVPLRNVESIMFRNGVIECVRKSDDAAGLSLLWPVEDAGAFLLPTTRLPERDEPYILNVELARARLMQITVKREDWALFEEMDKFADLAHEAQELFIEALQHISDPPKASVLADAALKKAMLLSERLSLRYAEQYLSLRFRNRGLGKHTLGCCIEPSRLGNERYDKCVQDMFSFVTVPVNWGQIVPEKGRYDFAAFEKCIERLAGKRMAINCGPLLCFEPAKVPGWLLAQKAGFEEVREQAYEFIGKIVSRYGKYVHFWTVISGMNARNCFGFTYEQMIEMTRTACLAAKAADAKGRRIIEITHPWGEYYATEKATIPPLVYADVVIQSGISFDAFGLVLELGKNQPGMHIRDMMQISSKLDCFATVNKPLHIVTAVPGHDGTEATDCMRAGVWKKPWDPAVQAEWVEQFYKIALGRSYVSTVTYSHLVDDSEALIPTAGLIDEKMDPKKAFLTIGKFQKMILKSAAAPK
ncbi:MAG: hypothetical protein FJ263_07905 [Planctomycetes bacterium]|nr:hypothetical protein [Planctomycetota bacterium]